MAATATKECLLCGDPIDDALTVCQNCDARTQALRRPKEVTAPAVADLVVSPSGMKTCPYCAEEIRAEATFCRFCQHDISGSAGDPGARRRLEEAVVTFQQQGYRITSRTDTTVQLVKPKTFSFWAAAAWFLLWGVGLVLYLFYYWSKRDATVLLTLEQFGGPRR